MTKLFANADDGLNTNNNDTFLQILSVQFNSLAINVIFKVRKEKNVTRIIYGITNSSDLFQSIIFTDVK